MSTQVVNGILLATDGTSIPLQKTLTDGADDQELMTDVTYTVTQSSIGRYFDGKTVNMGAVWSTSGICYAYVLRNGRCISTVSSMGTNALGGVAKICMLSHPVKLQPSDQLIVRTEA